MHKKGHVGVALLFYAPLLAWLLANGMYPFALLGFIIILSFPMLLDIDMRIPFVSHRGFTHTIGGILCLAAALALVPVFFIPLLHIIGIAAAPIIGFVFGMGLLVGVAHLFGDGVTYAGISPINFTDFKIALRLFSADSFLGNLFFRILGWIALLLAVGVGFGFLL
ncbi:hypothetical protein JMJ58_03780 [Haloterrigena salifodinae]|uniref:Metal-dependent hydrolase n=1 Tax=Haloterrigena salifodinae TaxID=2675099 RepID=A0A8T8E2Q3_9EURY|nr:hypothetical protein [Haloterrigena salifodinae]QRV16029.1 hypothetical protein JMJ58_03780 [Haloterrigena salifodinae]